MTSYRRIAIGAAVLPSLLELNELLDKHFPVLNLLDDNGTGTLVVIVEAHFLANGVAELDLLQSVMDFLRLGATRLGNGLCREPKRIVAGPSLENGCVVKALFRFGDQYL